MKPYCFLARVGCECYLSSNTQPSYYILQLKYITTMRCELTTLSMYLFLWNDFLIKIIHSLCVRSNLLHCSRGLIVRETLLIVLVTTGHRLNRSTSTTSLGFSQTLASQRSSTYLTSRTRTPAPELLKWKSTSKTRSNSLFVFSIASFSPSLSTPS